MMRQTFRSTKVCGAIAALLLTVAPAFAALPGMLWKNDAAQTRIQFTDVRWLGSRDAYSLTVKRGGSSVTMEVALADVKAIKVKEPANARQLAGKVRSGSGASAIPALEKLVQDYNMLGWDITMGRWLGEAYNQSGRTGDTISMVKGIVRKQPKAYGQPIMTPYWDALLKDNKLSTLDKALDLSVKHGTRDVAARAQNMRGDMAKSKGDYETALKDGYLRTWLLFSSERGTQPEALSKAAKCFDELGQVNYADKMRRELLKRYPDSEEAKALR